MQQLLTPIGDYQKKKSFDIFIINYFDRFLIFLNDCSLRINKIKLNEQLLLLENCPLYKEERISLLWKNRKILVTFDNVVTY